MLYFFGFGSAFGLFPAISREKQSHQLNVDKLMIGERKRKKEKKERKQSTRDEMFCPLDGVGLE